MKLCLIKYVNFFYIVNIFKKGIIYIENVIRCRIDGWNGLEYLLCNICIKKFNFGFWFSWENLCVLKIDEVILVWLMCGILYEFRLIGKIDDNFCLY